MFTAKVRYGIQYTLSKSINKIKRFCESCLPFEVFEHFRTLLLKEHELLMNEQKAKFLTFVKSKNKNYLIKILEF